MKLTKAQVLDIKKNKTDTDSDLAILYGCSRVHINHIRNGHRHKDVKVAPAKTPVKKEKTAKTHERIDLARVIDQTKSQETKIKSLNRWINILLFQAGLSALSILAIAHYMGVK